MLSLVVITTKKKSHPESIICKASHCTLKQQTLLGKKLKTKNISRVEVILR